MSKESNILVVLCIFLKFNADQLPNNSDGKHREQRFYY